MTEPLDAYTDSFMISLSPYGASLTFQESPAHPDPSSPAPPVKIATLRMSIEHAKTMVMIMRRHILQFEEQTGVRVPVAPRLLNQLGIAPEDWDTFWKTKG